MLTGFIGFKTGIIVEVYMNLKNKYRPILQRERSISIVWHTQSRQNSVIRWISQCILCFSKLFPRHIRRPYMHHYHAAVC
jgi:hypothetical protein